MIALVFFYWQMYCWNFLWKYEWMSNLSEFCSYQGFQHGDVLIWSSCRIIDSLYTTLATKWETCLLYVKSYIWATTWNCTNSPVWSFYQPPTFRLTQLATPRASWILRPSIPLTTPGHFHSKKEVWNRCWGGKLYHWLYSEFCSNISDFLMMLVNFKNCNISY